MAEQGSTHAASEAPAPVVDAGDVDAFVAGVMDGADITPDTPAEPAPAPQTPAEGEAPAPPAEAQAAGEKPSRWKEAIAAERSKQEARRREKETVRLDELRERASKDPAAFAQSMGLTVDGLLSALVPPRPGESDEQHSDPERAALLNRIEQLEAREQARQQEAELAETRRREQGELAIIADQIGDREVSRILADEAVPLAHQVAIAMIEANGITPNPALLRQVYPAALDAVEDHLTEREKERVQKALGVSKLQALLGRAPVAAGNGSKPQPTIGSTATATAAPRELSEHEELEAIFKKHWEQAS